MVPRSIADGFNACHDILNSNSSLSEAVKLKCAAVEKAYEFHMLPEETKKGVHIANLNHVMDMPLD